MLEKHVELKDGEQARPGRIIDFGSKEHAMLLHSGYPDIGDETEAKAVLADAKSTTEEKRAARAFLAALTTKPVVVSQKRGWKKIRGR